MTSAGTAFTRTFRSLRRHRNYRLFFAGQVVSVAGSWMQNTALVWLVIELRGSPLAVGGLVFARFLPFLALGLFAGVITDRVDTWRLVGLTQIAATLVAVGLSAITLTDTATLPLVYLLATLGGVVLVFDAPARHALNFQMVGPQELQNAVALNAGLFNASRIVGPALAGLVIAAVGTAWCFVINAVSFAAVFAALLAMRVDEFEPAVRQPGVRFLSGLAEAFIWVRNTAVPRIALTTIGLLSLLGFNFHVVIPLLAADTLNVGPRGLGGLSSAFGVGAVAGALGAAWLRRASMSRMLTAALAFVVLLLILAPITNAYLAAVVLALLGGAFVLMTTTANALVQLAAPSHLRGRVIAIYLFCFAGLTPIGGLLAGALTEVGGTVLAFGVAGVAGLATVIWASLAARRADTPPQTGRA